MTHLLGQRLTMIMALVLCTTSLLVAGDLSLRYVKTLGQANPAGIPFTTAGGHLAVDEAGNVYCGTPYYGSYLQKIAPDGRVLWSNFQNLPGFQGIALDKDYVYTCGLGAYSWRDIHRWKRTSGEMMPGWELIWKDDKTPVNDVRPFAFPTSLLVDEKYLYVVDSAGDELRRLDKVTGKEVPFTMRLRVVAPMDLALAANGNILLLTKESVFEIDKDAKPLRAPLIHGLRGAVALDVDKKTGMIYVAVGGTEAELLNIVRQYTPDGKPTGIEIGIGGDFQGKWTPRTFAFSGGNGDIALDGKGGLWVNPGWSTRMLFMPTITHLGAGPSYTPERTLMAVPRACIAADSDLSVYVGGQYKISWDNKIVWTSGLVYSGALAQYPTNHLTWPDSLVFADGKLLVVNTVVGTSFNLSPERGSLASGILQTPYGGHGASGICTVGRDVFVVDHVTGIVYRTNIDLTEKPHIFFTPPAEVKWSNATLAVSADKQRVYLSANNHLICYQVDGKKVWEMDAGPIGVQHKGVLYVAPPAYAPGILALDAATGSKLLLVGDKSVDGRPPLAGPMNMAVAGKGGQDYLFVQSGFGIHAFRIMTAE